MDWKARIEALLATGMTVDEIATAMGLTGNAIREVMSGRTKSPRADAALLLLALCDQRGIKAKAA